MSLYDENSSKNFSNFLRVHCDRLNSSIQSIRLELGSISINNDILSLATERKLLHKLQSSSLTQGRPNILENVLEFAHAEREDQTLVHLPNNASFPGTKKDFSASSASHDVIQAQQETYVLKRIGQLRKSGLWTASRLPKVLEPQPLLTHSDYLLDEVIWLACDFHEERKWKKAMAKQLAYAAKADYEARQLRNSQMEPNIQLYSKHNAQQVSHMVMQWWSNNKQVSYSLVSASGLVLS
ncbi:hypothetical protein Ciccas_003356 [Cichlidogyrus casuarinus]|uniref:HSA domain-containing protein n=1 Tax=Cichlidogyrus casuarinus TaxID=1844966 RepID=A0ABD2QEL8_9PLAT